MLQETLLNMCKMQFEDKFMSVCRSFLIIINNQLYESFDRFTCISLYTFATRLHMYYCIPHYVQSNCSLLLTAAAQMTINWMINRVSIRQYQFFYDTHVCAVILRWKMKFHIWVQKLLMFTCMGFCKAFISTCNMSPTLTPKLLTLSYYMHIVTPLSDQIQHITNIWPFHRT